MEIIQYCLKTGQIYESENYHNVVFVGMDQSGIPRYAALVLRQERSSGWFAVHHRRAGIPVLPADAGCPMPDEAPVTKIVFPNKL